MSNPFADAEPPFRPSQVEGPNEAENPYASPRERSGSPPHEVGMWRDGKLLVAHRDVVFPRICVRTNEPAQRYRRVSLSWSYPIDWSGRFVTFHVGMCEACWRRYRRRRVAGWLLVIGAAISLYVTIVMGIPVLPLLAIPLICTGIYLSNGAQVFLAVKRGRPPYYWIRGAHPSFVASLPDWSEKL